jgi:hypothetical protein
VRRVGTARRPATCDNDDSSLIGVFVHGGSGKHYGTHDRVPVIVNKVGPFNNPSETYQYYSLPFCKEGTGGKSRRQRHDLGELLVGDRKASLPVSLAINVGPPASRPALPCALDTSPQVVSPYEINFLDSFSWRSLCKVELSDDEVSHHRASYGGS